MAEEVHDASRNLPKSILGAVALNGLLSFIMAMTLMFCVGDAEAVLAAADDYNGYAFLAIFQNAVSNPHALNMMVFLVIFGLINCAISETAVASRQIWSFARDNGLPFSGWLSHVYPGQNIPLRAVLVSFCSTTLLSLINIGSDAALNAIISLAGVSVLTSYLISIGCLIWRRLYGAPLPPHAWSLGRYGLSINIAAFCCVLPLWFFAL
jgi:amino acid transporter